MTRGPSSTCTRTLASPMFFFLVADDANAAAQVADALFASDKAVTGVFREPALTAAGNPAHL